MSDWCSLPTHSPLFVCTCPFFECVSLPLFYNNCLYLSVSLFHTLHVRFFVCSLPIYCSLSLEDSNKLLSHVGIKKIKYFFLYNLYRLTNGGVQQGIIAIRTLLSLCVHFLSKGRCCFLLSPLSFFGTDRTISDLETTTRLSPKLN